MAPGQHDRPAWTPYVWQRTIIPRHSFTSWLFHQQRLPVRQQLAQRTSAQVDNEYCSMCPMEIEDQEHVFFKCGWAKQFWESLLQWWPIPLRTHDMTSFSQALQRLPGPRAKRRISCAVIAATIYQIWRARNSRTFEHRELPVHQVVAQTKDQLRQRICFLNTTTGKYMGCIDDLCG